MTGRRWGLACAILGAACFSLKAIFVKLAYRYGVDTETLLALRMLYALPLFVLLGIFGPAGPQKHLAARDYLSFALLGFLGYYLASYLDFLGLRLISASLERLILFTGPTIVVLLVAWRQRAWPTARVWGALALCYAGVALAMGHDLRARQGGFWQGVLLVFGCTLSYSIYLERAGQILPRIGSARFAAWATGAASVFALLQFLLMRPASALVAQPWQVHAVTLATAVFATVMPIWLVSEGMRILGSGPTAIIGSLGPVLTTLFAWALLDEPLGLLQLAGLVLVIAGVQRIARTG
jgi:drug/metabolite transporter (DMT)-like permease